MSFQNTYTEALRQARGRKEALPAFNLFNQQSLRGIVAGAKALNKPVILEISTGVVKRIGAAPLYAMIEAETRAQGVPLHLHLDHCKDLELACACCDVGWHSVMVDFSHLSLEENIVHTKTMVEYAHPRNVAVEGEVGVIAGVEDDIASDVQKLASFEDTMHYIEQTGVDAVAPACGTAHGTYKSEPKLQYDLIEQLSKATDVPLVLHGGTGLSDEQFWRMIDNGISKINLSTVLKETWYNALVEYLPAHNVSSPMGVDIAAEEAFRDVACSFIRLFSREGRA